MNAELRDAIKRARDAEQRRRLARAHALERDRERSQRHEDEAEPSPRVAPEHQMPESDLNAALADAGVRCEA